MQLKMSPHWGHMHKIILLKTAGNNNKYDGTCTSIGNSYGNNLTIMP